MKKKIYEIPQTSVVVVELQRMIALSKVDGEADPDSPVLGRDEEFEEEEDGYVKSRRSRNRWDDEDYERDDDRW